MLTLWRAYQNNERAPRGHSDWWMLFGKLKDIRPWGPQDRIDAFTRDYLSRELERHPAGPIQLEVDLWYRDGPTTESEEILGRALAVVGGEILDSFRLSEIKYHGVLVRVPNELARRLAELESPLAIADEIMSIRPQSMARFDPLAPAPDLAVQARAAPPAPIFERAQISMDCCSMPTDEEMLDGLRRLLKRKGRLTVDIIKRARSVPSTTAYLRRFGNTRGLYALVGYSPPARRVNEFAARRRARRVALSDELTERLRVVGADVTQKPSGARLTVNGIFVIAICVVYGSRQEGVRQRWSVSNVRTPRDLTVVARMDPDLDQVIDYYVVPDIAFSRCRFLRIGQTRVVSPLACYRRENLIGIENMIAGWSPRPAEDEIEGLDA